MPDKKMSHVVLTVVYDDESESTFTVRNLIDFQASTKAWTRVMSSDDGLTTVERKVGVSERFVIEGFRDVKSAEQS